MSRIVGEVADFAFNETSLLISHVVPLASGRHMFSLVLIISNMTTLSSSVVVDVVSKSKLFIANIF